MADGRRGRSGSAYVGERKGECGLLAEGRSQKARRGVRTRGVPEMQREFFEGFGSKGRRDTDKNESFRICWSKNFS